MNFEIKNYKFVNPLNALNDKPINSNYNQAIWALHKKNTLLNLKNIKFYFPHLNFNSSDPLKTRLLVLVFFFLSIFWGIQNEKIHKNILGFFNFNRYMKSNDSFFVQAWLKPPEYTNLGLTNLEVSNKSNNAVKKKIIPINSELNIIIRSDNKNFAILIDDKEIPIIKKEKNNYQINYNIVENNIITIKKNKKYYKKWFLV